MRDPFGGLGSRFPQSPAGGRLTHHQAPPTGPDTRPFGLRFVTDAPMVAAGRHDKETTRETKKRPTEHTLDGKEPRTEKDEEEYVEYDTK